MNIEHLKHIYKLAKTQNIIFHYSLIFLIGGVTYFIVLGCPSVCLKFRKIDITNFLYNIMSHVPQYFSSTPEIPIIINKKSIYRYKKINILL